MAAHYIAFTSSSANLTLTRTLTISAAVYDSTTNTIDTGFTSSIVFSADTTSVGSVSISPATVTAVLGIASTTLTATGIGQVDLRAHHAPHIVDGTQSLTVVARTIVFTSSTAEIANGFSKTLTAELRDTTGAVMTNDSTTPITLTKTGAGAVAGLTTVTSAAGIISAGVTATTSGSITITGAYNSTVTSGSTTFTIQPYHIVITSSTSPLATSVNLNLVAEVRDISLAVDTTNASSVTFSQSGTGSLTGTGSATAVNGIASRLVTGATVGALTITASATSAISGTATMEVTNATRVTASGAQGRWFSQAPFRITLFDMTGASRGRGAVKAVISDAKYIGCSSYLNQGGEMFFTLPYNHPQIAECDPLNRHYRVDRWDEEDAVYRTVATGILQDYSATDNETVFFGVDYLGVLNQTLTDASGASSGNTVTYNDKTVSFIFQAEMSTVQNEANSRLGFITVEATINASATTYDLFTAGEQRTNFLENVASIAAAGTTNKVVFGNRIESSTQSYNSFFLDMNHASAPNNSLRLVYGANVKRFSFSPNFRSLRTRAMVIGTTIFNGIVPQKIWSPVATSALASTYGIIDRVDLQQDIISQSAASSRAAYNLYQSSPDKLRAISVSVVDGSIIPFKNYKIGDDIRVVIERGSVNVDANLTIRGQKWVGREDGSEEISFEFFNRDQQSYELTPYRATSSLQSILSNNNNLNKKQGDEGDESTTVESGGDGGAGANLIARYSKGRVNDAIMVRQTLDGYVVQRTNGAYFFYSSTDTSLNRMLTAEEAALL